MKSVVAVLYLVLSVSLVSAQDRLSKEDARRYARACVEQVGSLDDAPLKTEVDTAKACAVRGEGGGAMVIPDKKLTAAKLARAGRDVVPLGQLWLRKWTVMSGGKVVAKGKLRIVKVNVDDKERPMLLFLLGVQKGKLVVYGKDDKALLALPLKKEDLVQELPLDIEWQRGEKNIDSLTLAVLGKHRVVLPVTRE